MVAQQHDHGVLLQPELVEAVEEVAEPVVGHGHLAGVPACIRRNCSGVKFCAKPYGVTPTSVPE